MPELYQDKKFLKELEKNLKRGENHSSAILSEKEVIDIKTRRKNGEKRKDVFIYLIMILYIVTIVVGHQIQ